MAERKLRKQYARPGCVVPILSIPHEVLRMMEADYRRSLMGEQMVIEYIPLTMSVKEIIRKIGRGAIIILPA